MPDALIWWAAIELVGVLAAPIAFVLFAALPDRGYSLAKTAGLLLVTYVLWMAGSAHVLPYRTWTIVLVLGVMGAVALAIAVRRRQPLAEFVKSRWLHLLFLDAVFTVTFALALFLRAHIADISVGERPTDSGIINAISRTRFFPPEDPWLAGHSINYYYFGHLQVATLSKLTAIPTRISFNLALASVPALAAIAAAGVAYNLIVAGARWRFAFLFAALAPLFLLVLSNIEGVFELMSAHGVGSKGFYDLLDIRGLEGPSSSDHWYPTQPFWWGRANSFVTAWPDRLFPYNRLLNGELHSEVLALPFTTLLIAVALNLWRSESAASPPGGTRVLTWGFAGLALGATAFTHIWDGPTYFALIVLAVATTAVRRAGRLDVAALRRAGVFVGVLIALTVGLFLPAYLINFGSLGGIELTRARDATRLHHFLYQWLPVLTLIATLAVLSLGRLRRPLAAAGAASAILAAAVFPWTIVTLKNDGFGGLLDEVSDRGTNLLTVALIATLFVLVVLAFFHQMSEGREEQRGPPVAAFALLLSGLTLLLLLGVEFYWVKDPFWVPRFNTLNKVSFQGWTMTSVAGALGVYYLASRPWPRLRLSLARAGWALAATAVVLAGFVYPVTSTYSVTNSFSNDRYLDGLRFIRNDHPGDYQGVLWLGGYVRGTPVVMEAVGDSHSGFARVSAFTGLPTVLGWPLHEFWFRGSYAPQGTRRDDVQRAYQATDPSALTAILRRYDVEYVYVGPLEREAYGPIDLGAFAEAMDTVYRNDEVTIFRVRHNQATPQPAATSTGAR